MGRSAWLAIGAITAAIAVEPLGTNIVGAFVALATAALLVLGEIGPKNVARRTWPIVVGAALIAARLAILPPGPPALETPPEGNGPWTFVVLATGSPRDGQQTATLATSGEVTPSFTVAATLPRYPVVIPGNRIRLEGSIRPRPESSYGEYLARIGAAGTLTARSIEIVPAPADAGRHLEELRRGAAEALAGVLPEPEAGLAAGILIGLRDRVDRDLAAAFTTAGVSHVVAISGWNIAIVAAAIATVAGGLGRRRRSVVTIVAIVAYVCFAGASASVVRAAMMAGVVLLARESGRAGRAAAALGWAATLLLLSDPALIEDAGFQLSSLATAGLIAWATPITDWLDRVGRGRGRLPRWLSESLGVSLAAQAATMPIVLVSFGRLAVLSPLVNLVVVPLVAPAMAVGIVALAAGVAVAAGAPAGVGAVLAAPGWVVLRILVGIVEIAAGLPFASVTLEPPLDSVAAAASVLGLAGIVWWRRRRRALPRTGTNQSPTGPATAGVMTTTRARDQRAGGHAKRAATIGLVVAVTVTGAVAVTRPDGAASVSILDVGQGDAILIEGSRGGRVLVDGGPDPDRLLVALDRRIPPWDRRIDSVILSHPHEDHVAGLAMLLARYDVDRVMEPGMRGPGPGYSAWLDRLAGDNSPARLAIAAGDRLVVDEIALEVLWPKRGGVPLDPPDGGTGINNISVVLAGRVGNRQFLLMGDVEEEIDPQLLAGGLRQVDLLKVAHHGSRTATTQAFVDAVRPRVAVASAGIGNPYGHPTRVTLERLSNAGARVLRTDQDGTVIVTFMADGMTVRSEGARPSRTTPKPSPPASAAFRCAIPVTALVPEREPGAIRSEAGDWRPAPVADADPSPRRTVGYHRIDDRSRAGGGRLPPAVPGSPTLVLAARAGCRGGGGLARCPDRGARSRHRSATRRGGCPAARRRQGAPGERSVARAPPWCRFGRVVDGGWPSRARPRRRRSSRDTPA